MSDWTDDIQADLRALRELAKGDGIPKEVLSAVVECQKRVLSQIKEIEHRRGKRLYGFHYNPQIEDTERCVVAVRRR